MNYRTKPRSQDICHRVNRLLKAFESVARLRRYELSPGETEQIIAAAEKALEQTRLTLLVPNHKQKMVFVL
jgi:hypothetical protein